jgi:two-component system OmpR family sensor kinase
VPLWATLVAALLAIAAVGLLVMGVAGTTVLERYLVDRTDKELQTFATTLSQRVTDVQRGFGGPTAGQVQVPGAYYAAILAPDGTLASETRSPLRGNSSPPDLPIIGTARAAELAGEPFSVRPRSGSGSSWRVLAEPLSNGGGTVVVAASLDDVDQTVSRLGAIDVVVGLIVLGLLAIASYLVVRVSLRPLAEVEATAAAIAGGDLSRRLPDAPPGTEVGRLTESLNTMLTQIETAFRARERSEAAALASEERMRRFIADASHELRTPLTSIRGFAELYRQGAAADDAEVARMMRRIEDESVRMGLLVEDLLMLARLDEARPIERAEVDLLAIAADAVADLTALDPGRPVALHRVPDADGPRPLVIGDDARLRQVVANLTSNAVAHTPAGTRVTVRVGITAPDVDGTARAFVEVADEGPGLTDEQRTRVFERFYRAEPSRVRTPTSPSASGPPLAGTGLGLSIVAALVAAHDGRVEVDSEPGRGATFRVLLPLAPGGVTQEGVPVAL